MLPAQMRWRDGTAQQKALYLALVSTYALGLLLACSSAIERVGRPDVGFTMDGLSLSPSRRDAGDAGLRGGARLLRGERLRDRGPVGAARGLAAAPEHGRRDERAAWSRSRASR